MGLITTPQKEIDNYFASENVSQSSLKRLLDGFTQSSGDTDSLLIGSAVDTILTGETGRFEKQFYVSKLEKKPSDVEVSIVNQVFDNLMQEKSLNEISTLSDYSSIILEAIEDHKWYNNLKQETKTKKIIEKCTDYFEELKKAYNKKLLTTKQKDVIDSVVMSLTTNSRTSFYFNRERQDRQKNADFYYQVPIYFEHNDVLCKALIDLLIIIKNEEEEMISVFPIDLKTMSGNTLQFIYKLKRYRYDIQAAWYTLAVEKWIEQISLNYRRFSKNSVIIKPFTFIVESTTSVGTPLIYEVDEELLLIGKQGRPVVKYYDLFSEDKKPITLFKKINGYEDLLEEYLHYETTEELKIMSKAKNGIFKLSWDGIV